MKYRDTKENSGETLRRVVALMAKHTAAYHPVSYTVWYEYTSERNPKLKQAIDDHVASGAQLDDKSIQEFFDKYIVERDEEALRRLYTEFQRIVGDIAHSAQETGAQASQYGDSLAQIGRRLEEKADQLPLQAIVEELIAGTQHMHGWMETMEKQLTERRQEVEELRTAISEVQSESNRDPMTGLLNRRGFDAGINQVLAPDNPDRRETCLLIVDIDHFKKINDTYGHLFGDKIICAVALALKNGVKGRDIVARFGGEEFVVVLTKTSLAGARAVSEQLRAAVEQGRVRRGETTLDAVTISIGVAAYHDGESVNEFIHRADLALYASKQNGRNRVTIAPEI
jgi:diguanylate cyclase